MCDSKLLTQMGIPSRNELSVTIKVAKTDGGARQISLKSAKGGEVLEVLDVSAVLCEASSHGMFLIGRNKEGLDLVLRHDTVSRVQAAVLCGGIKNDVMVVDLKSSKGTCVNGTAIAPHVPMRLNDGDVLQFGRSERTYTLALGVRDDRGMGVPKAATAAAAAAAAVAAVAAAREEQAHTASSSAPSQSDLAATLPVADSIALQGHTKPVVCLATDSSGSRLLSGSLDTALGVYDFSGMGADFRPYKTIEPEPGHAVTWAAFTPTGDAFVCVASAPTFKVFDRDANSIMETTRGDVYIRDPTHTKGHLMDVTQAHWHPNAKKNIVLKGVLLSASMDGTLRVWSMEAPLVWGKLVNRYIRPSRPQGDRASLQALTLPFHGGAQRVVLWSPLSTQQQRTQRLTSTVLGTWPLNTQHPHLQVRLASTIRTCQLAAPRHALLQLVPVRRMDLRGRR